MARQLWDVRATDPEVLIAATGILAACALVACWIPPGTATRFDPMAALKFTKKTVSGPAKSPAGS